MGFLILSGCVLPPWPIGAPAPTYGEGEETSDQDEDSDNEDTGLEDEDSDEDDAASDDDDDSLNLNDQDGDGWADEDDCDDNDPSVHPGADEVHCDGIDNDCDDQLACNLCEAEARLSLSLTPGDYQYGGSLTLDSLVDENFSPGNYYFDVYAVETLAIGFLDVSLTSAAFRPHLEIRDSSCEVLSEDSPLLSDTAWLFTGVQPGDSFYVVAGSNYPDQVGTYSIGLSVTGL